MRVKNKKCTEKNYTYLRTQIQPLNYVLCWLFFLLSSLMGSFVLWGGNNGAQVCPLTWYEADFDEISLRSSYFSLLYITVLWYKQSKRAVWCLIWYERRDNWWSSCFTVVMRTWGQKWPKSQMIPLEDATNLCSHLYCARSERNMRV